jgi:hypothetical protein
MAAYCAMAAADWALRTPTVTALNVPARNARRLNMAVLLRKQNLERF